MGWRMNSEQKVSRVFAGSIELACSINIVVDEFCLDWGKNAKSSKKRSVAIQQESQCVYIYYIYICLGPNKAACKGCIKATDKQTFLRKKSLEFNFFFLLYVHFYQVYKNDFRYIIRLIKVCVFFISFKPK